jgi:energy-coupling factor transporter ATP-binding protein EcfA2
VEIYEQANHELLILGEPGTGKSTLLLHLAQYLIDQAEQDMTSPLPVYLPLSSWAVKRLPLHEWLGEQVSLVYDVPRQFSQHWVREEGLLLLLDGLDEMEASARTACIAAINAYYHDHLQPLVICSRTEEYAHAAASERLALQQAVVVQALTPAQVDVYLIQAGKPLAALRAVLRKNSTLAALATTSLMLHILMLTYHGTSVRQLPQKEALLRQQIWTDYVEQMVERKGDREHYPLNQTITWLGWLARQMRQHSQTIFYLEQLQP